MKNRSGVKKSGVIVSMLEQPNTVLMQKYAVNALLSLPDVTTDRLFQLSTIH